jgi:DNA-binding HxlR family transcriptional regulator
MESQKITNVSERRPRRSYDDACGAAHALDLVGERWALLVMRELMLGPKRFNDIKAGLPGISANVLTQRLEGLEKVGVLVRRRLPPPVSAQVYELTAWGYEAEPIFQVLGRWAARSPTHDPGLPLSAASLLLSFRTMLDPARAEGIDARIGLLMGAESFLGHLHDGIFDIERGVAEGADLVLSGAPPAIGAIVYGGQPIAAMEAAGALTVRGDRALLDRFVTLFPLPPKTAPEG